MLDRHAIKLSDSVRIIQIFEKNSDGNVIAEYHDLEIINDRDGMTQTLSFVWAEFSSETLRTAADYMDEFRFQETGLNPLDK